MKRYLITVLVLLAVVLTTSAALASTYYDVVQGLASNILVTTNWAGSAATQVGNNGWWYRTTIVSGSSDPKNVYPWTPFWGDSYVWESSISAYALMGWEHSYNPGNSAFGWSGQTAGAVPDETKGVICNSNENAEALKNVAGNGTAVAFRHGWNTTWFQPIVLEWQVPAAGNASAQFVCYSAPNNPQSGTTSGGEIHLGLYRNGVFVQQLAWTTAIGSTNTGVGNGVGLAASGIAVQPGDSIVVLTRSAKYDPYGTRQDNISISGGITLSQNTPGTITGVVSNPSGPVAGASVSTTAGGTTTGSDGSYTLTVDPGTYTVTATAPQHATTTINNVTVTSGGNTPLDISITPWGTVSGIVSDVSGPVSGATVVSGTRSTTTAANGSYTLSLSAGSHSITASAPQHVDTVVNASVADGVNTPLNISLTKWGVVTGVVSGSGGTLAGATVKVVGGTATTTTATDGSYSLTLADGTYTLRASKPGYEPLEKSATFTGGTQNTVDFLLADGVWITGTVTEVTPPNAAIAGVNVWTTDGGSNTTTDSTGHYSLGVSRGNYAVSFAKTGFVPKTIAVDASTSGSTQDISLKKGWDLATDLTTDNPNGPWTYGWDLGTAGSFTKMPYVHVDYSGIIGIDHYWPSNGGESNNQTMTIKNTTFAPFLDTCWLSTNSWREAQKVICSAGTSHTGMTGTERNVTRFTAPKGGYYNVTVKFSGAKMSGTTSGVAIRRGAGYIFGNPTTDPKALNGFAGKSQNGYTDSTGATPTLQFSEDMELQLGEKIDAILYNLGTGWTQVDMTVEEGNTFIKGRVTSSLGYAIPEAKVSAEGTTTYETITDANGDYVLSVKPEVDYEVTVTKANHDAGFAAFYIEDGQIITRDFTLNHQNKWDLVKDFTTAVNPVGQWAFGSIDQANGNVFTPYPALSMRVGDSGSATVPVWGTGSWSGLVGKNTSQLQPHIFTAWNADPNYWNIAPQTVFVSSGNRNGLAAVRWTCPSDRVVDITYRITSVNGTGATQSLSLARNGVNMGSKLVDGFVGFAGTEAVGYTDSIARSGAPEATVHTLLPLSSGDTIDFVHDMDYQSGYGVSPGYGTNGYPLYALGLSIQIENGSLTSCSTIASVKSQPVGTTVYLTTPSKIASATASMDSFNKVYGSPTTIESSFYVQNTDRTQGLKCINDGSIPAYAAGYMVKLTGIVDVDSTGQKILRAQAVIPVGLEAAPNPMGKSSKSLTANGTLVKVWGKIKELVDNPVRDSESWLVEGVPFYPWYYEYMVITDGGVDVKIPMHVQFNQMPMTIGDISSLTVGDYVAVTGIATTTNGTDVVVCPAHHNRIFNYTDNGM